MTQSLFCIHLEKHGIFFKLFLLWLNLFFIYALSCGTLSSPCITFLSPLQGYLFQQQLQEWPRKFISFYSNSHSKLNPKRRLGQFVGYEWQWISLGNIERRFSSTNFWGNLLNQLCTTSNWTITMGGLPLFIKMDDHVVYFEKFHYTC